jgi:DNA primase
MDVVALAQHGVEFAVATLGTATTPTHAQKLFRVTDTVIFCFDGDEAGRRAAWRALENTLSVLADGKDARFLFLPDGEDPDDAIRKRGKPAFEALLDQATPLSDFLLNELAARHPPRSAEGRAALVNAAKPLLAQLTAPVFGALLRQRLAGLAGLPEREMTALLPLSTPVFATPPVRRGGGASRPAPSLIRGLIQCVLLQPELVRRIPVPKPLGANLDGAALAALVAFCETSKVSLTTAGLMQHFAGGTYEDVFVAALTGAESEGLTGELLEIELVEGVKRYWLNVQKRGDDAESRRAPPAELSVEETERARQRQLARDRVGGGT